MLPRKGIGDRDSRAEEGEEEKKKRSAGILLLGQGNSYVVLSYLDRVGEARERISLRFR